MMYFKYKDTDSKQKDERKWFSYTNIRSTDLKTKNIIRDKQKLFIIMKRSIHQEVQKF